MKDRKRKKRDWKNDNRIMKKYGQSIHREIERVFKKAASNHVKHTKLKVIVEQLKIKDGAYKDISEEITWRL